MAGETFEYLMERALKEQLEIVHTAVMRGDLPDSPPGFLTDGELLLAYVYQIGRIRGIQFAMEELVKLRQRVLTDEGFE